MLTETEWVALGVAATLLTSYVAHRLGYIQIGLMRQANDLSVLKSVPKIETIFHIDKRYVNPSIFPPFYYLASTIHNHGELPAKQLKGYCKVFSPTNPAQQVTIPIGIEFLGTPPRKLSEYRLDGTFIDSQRPQAARFNVDVEFSYLGGLPKEQPQHYSAKYEYDSQNEQFVSPKSNK
jgi:hypothetical protein